MWPSRSSPPPLERSVIASSPSRAAITRTTMPISPRGLPPSSATNVRRLMPARTARSSCVQPRSLRGSLNHCSELVHRSDLHDSRAYLHNHECASSFTFMIVHEARTRARSTARQCSSPQAVTPSSFRTSLRSGLEVRSESGNDCGCMAIRLWHEVRVDVQCRGRVAVSQAACDSPHVDSCAQQPCRDVVPKIVQPHALQPDALAGPTETT